MNQRTCPGFVAYPGTISLRITVYLEVIRDLLDSLAGQGFRRILLLNGHAGNAPAENLAKEWRGQHAEAQVIFHGWLVDPKIWALAKAIEPEVGHASWVENFPWVRVLGADIPTGRKPFPDAASTRVAGPSQMRDLLGDGSTGGPYSLPDETTAELWAAAVADIRDTIDNGWR